MIKKLLSVVVCCTVFYTAKSQITKGNWMVGGSGNFNTNNVSTGSQAVSFQLSPNIGYFFYDKFAAGIKFNLSSQDLSSYTAAANVGLSIKTFSVGPYLRYYFLDANRTANFFTEANYSYGTYNGSGYYTISNGKSNKFSFSLGSVIYFNSSVGAEFMLGYYNNKDITLNITNNGIQMALGFQIHLERL